MELTMQEKLRLINFFEFLLNEEISKPLGEMNSEAVDNYIKILLHLQDKHVELSPEFIDEQVREIFHKEEIAEPETAKTTKKHYSKNKIWLVAACVTILVALFSILSFSSEKSVKDVLEDFFGTFEFIPFGEEIDIKNETFGKDNKSKQYKNIYEFAEKENIDLLYPSNMIEDINRITITSIDETTQIHMIFNNSDLFITVNLDSKIPQEIKNVCNSKFTSSGIDFYLCTMNDINQAQAYFEYDNNMYIIMNTNENNLMKILNNMEEIKYEN